MRLWILSITKTSRISPSWRPQVVIAFEQGDEMAAAIMEDAAKHLSQMALALGNRLAMQKEAYPLGLCGRLLSEHAMDDEKSRRKGAGGVPPLAAGAAEQPAESGAVYLAAKRAGVRMGAIGLEKAV